MLKYFSLVLDLLEIGVKSKYLAIAEEIEKKKNMPLFCYHKYGFLFLAFKDLLDGKISEEEFVQSGDVESLKKIYSYKQITSDTFLKGVVTKTELLDKNILYVVDELSWKLYESELGDVDVLHC